MTPLCSNLNLKLSRQLPMPNHFRGIIYTGFSEGFRRMAGYAGYSASFSQDIRRIYKKNPVYPVASCFIDPSNCRKLADTFILSQLFMTVISETICHYNITSSSSFPLHYSTTSPLYWIFVPHSSFNPPSVDLCSTFPLHSQAFCSTFPPSFSVQK